MASNPLFIIPDFFCIFQTNLAMATLGLKEMGKFLWEGREKGKKGGKREGQGEKIKKIAIAGSGIRTHDH